MTKHELEQNVNDNIEQTKEALQLIINELNQGQRKKILKNEEIKILLDRYGVVVE